MHLKFFPAVLSSILFFSLFCFLTLFLSYREAIAKSSCPYEFSVGDGLNFKILVDVNQLDEKEATNASRFAADGVWAITVNSSSNINWRNVFDLLNANKWIVTEDNPFSTVVVDFVPNQIGRIVDGAMFYYENGLNTILTSEDINKYSSHIVPGFGPLGNRIVVLARNFGAVKELDDVRVSGEAFEVIGPGMIGQDICGCKYALSKGKKCYFLLPMFKGAGSSYLDYIKNMTNKLAKEGVLKSPDFFMVPAIYVRQSTGLRFLSVGPDDQNSMESVVNWLVSYRGYTTPANTSADLNNDGKVDIFDYNILMSNFGKTGVAGFVKSDINKDGKVDIFDYNILISNFGK